MKRLLTLALLGLCLPAPAQTNAEIVAKALSARNAPVCDALGLAPTCNDGEARDAWCVANNKPAGPMCVASDTRSADQRVVTAAQLFAEKQADQDKVLAERARRHRRATLVLIEIAIADDPAVLAAVCAATKRIPEKDCK